VNGEVFFSLFVGVGFGLGVVADEVARGVVVGRDFDVSAGSDVLHPLTAKRAIVATVAARRTANPAGVFRSIAAPYPDS
jgi:hypothetical protein